MTAKVHATLQRMTNELSVHENQIAVNAIAAHLNIDNDDLVIHLNILRDLYFLKFTDDANQNIRLTLTGISTVVPGRV